MIFGRAGLAWFASGLFVSAPVLAVADSQRFDIPAQPLPAALKAFAAQAHIQLFYVYSVVANARGNAIQGELDTHQALEELLRNTGLQAIYQSDSEVTIRLPGAPQSSESAAEKKPVKTPRLGQSDPRPTDDTTASSVKLEEVIVTSQKREERLQDVPIPVTAITASNLADESRYSLQDYYSQVPGLSLTPNEFSGAPTIAIRGITSGDFTNPTVGITVDDVPFGPSTVNGGGYFAPDLDPSDLARIEVLRGPQGTLYGASSIGGLIKYVTADPSTDAFSGRVEAGLSTLHHGPGVGYNVSAAVNIPVTDTFAVRASGFSREEPGYVENVRTGQQGINKAEIAGTHLSALWRPSEQFSLKLSALFQDNKLFGSPYVTLGTGLGDLQQDFLPHTGEVDRKFEAYSATATAKLGTFTLTSVTGYSVSRLYDKLDYTQILGYSLTDQVFGTADTINTDNTHTNKISQEIRLATPIGPYFDWLVGGFYTHEDSPWALEILPVTPTSQRLGSLVYTTFDSVYAEWAAFTDLTWHVTDTVDVQFGGRESKIRQTFQETDIGEQYVEIVENTTSPAVTPELRTSQNAFTYLVTPSWKITPQLMLYARFASGYRPGGINNVIGGVDLPTEFQPDKTRNYELGTKGSAFDHRLSFDASVYYIDWSQIQLSLINPNNGQNYFSNGSRAKSQGLELSAQATPLNGLHLGGWVSLNDAVLTRDFPPGNLVSGASGDRLPYTSRFSASTSADYEVPLGAFTAIFGATASYVGPRVGAFQTAPQRQALPGYTKTDLHATAKKDHWTVDLYINNLTDARGIVGGGIGTAIPSSFGVIQPRTTGVSVAWTF
jgi:outer membrane receptor protein involved in Fe transport